MLVVLKALTIIRKSGLVMPFTVAAVLAAVLAVLFEAVAVTGMTGLALLAGGVLLAARGRENGARSAVAALRARAVRSPGLVAVTFAVAAAPWPLAVARRELDLGWETPAAAGAAVAAILLVRLLATTAAGKVTMPLVEEPAADDEGVLAVPSETPEPEAIAEPEPEPEVVQ